MKLSVNNKDKFYVLIFGSNFIFYLDNTSNFKNLHDFAENMNENFKEILQISLYCGEHTAKGFHLVLIQNNIILADRHILHISNNYLKKLFTEEKINDKISNKCNNFVIKSPI